MNNINVIPSVNFHVWEPCNMRCKFCFATFQDVKKSILPKGHLPKKESIALVRAIGESNLFSKITFAGGEPLLCPWISELIAEAKSHGLTTMVVTNGSHLSEQFILENEHHLDWIAVSIDSLSGETNRLHGREQNSTEAFGLEAYTNIIARIKRYDYKLKINTVVTSINKDEDMNEFIQWADPARWKILQVLPVTGQNDSRVENLLITDSVFQSFLNRHFFANIPETNNLILNSYVMIDPAGRFFTNKNNKHGYSKEILKVGIDQAFSEMDYDFSKFLERKGEYEW